MSLIHWWPLSGDTRDKITGKSGTLKSGGVVSGAGKIGQCYSSNNNHNFTSATWSCADGIEVLNSSLVGEVGDEYSFACWFKVHGKHGQYQSCIMSSGDWNAGNCWVVGFDQTNTAIFCPVNNYNKGRINLSSALVNDQWYHLATVYKNNVSTAYLNGIKVGEVSAQGIYQSSSTTAYIGRDQAHNGFFPFNGDINDLRIYDHALSQVEVRELSKALIVHYTFDDILAEPTTNLITSPHNIKYVSGASDNNVNAAGLINATTTISGTYTLSGEYNIAASDSATGPRITMLVMYEGQSNWSSLGRAEVIRDGTWRAFTLTGTTDPSKTVAYCGAWIFDYSSSGSARSCYARNLQFELKDHATPYTPTSRESMLYNEAETIQPDTMSDIVLAKDSASGSCSLKCAGSTVIRHTPAGDGSNATASFWLKKFDTSGQMVVFADANSKLAFGPYTNYSCISCQSGIASQVLTDKINEYWKNDEWNHVAVRKNAANEYSCFVNGNKVANTTGDHWTHDTYLSIGCRISGGVVGRQMAGLLDDFRLYYTYLSDSDILELYKTKAYITDKGDIMCGEFIEDKNSIQITDKYTTEALELIEDFAVNAEYERVEYLEFSEKEYIDTGLAFPNENIPIIIEADIVKTVLSSNDCLAGCGNGAWSGPVMLNCHNGTCEFGVNGYATASDGSGSFAAGERLIIRAEIGTKSTEHNWYKNGVKINLGSNAYRDRTGSSSTLYIGAFHVGTGASVVSNSCWTGHLYFFKVWYGCYSRILVPARRKSDGVLGLYDAAGSGFYPNISGNGQLKVGQNVDKTEATFYENGKILSREIIEI